MVKDNRRNSKIHNSLVHKETAKVNSKNSKTKTVHRETAKDNSRNSKIKIVRKEMVKDNNQRRKIRSKIVHKDCKEMAKGNNRNHKTHVHRINKVEGNSRGNLNKISSHVLKTNKTGVIKDQNQTISLQKIKEEKKFSFIF